VIFSHTVLLSKANHKKYHQDLQKKRTDEERETGATEDVANSNGVYTQALLGDATIWTQGSAV